MRYKRLWEDYNVNKCKDGGTKVLDKVDWTKPLTCVHPHVTKVKYIGCYDSGVLNTTYVCKLFYGREDRWYYRLYFSNGLSADVCAESINLKNKEEFIDRYIVIDTVDGNVTNTYGTREAAEWMIKHALTPDKYYIQHARYAK